MTTEGQDLINKLMDICMDDYTMIDGGNRYLNEQMDGGWIKFTNEEMDECLNGLDVQWFNGSMDVYMNIL